MILSIKRFCEGFLGHIHQLKYQIIEDNACLYSVYSKSQFCSCLWSICTVILCNKPCLPMSNNKIHHWWAQNSVSWDKPAHLHSLTKVFSANSEPQITKTVAHTSGHDSAGRQRYTISCQTLSGTNSYGIADSTRIAKTCAFQNRKMTQLCCFVALLSVIFKPDSGLLS